VIVMMDINKNKLTNQKDALAEYIDALVIDEPALSAVQAKESVEEDIIEIASSNRGMIDDIEKSKEERVEEINENKLLEVFQFTVSGLKLAIAYDKINDVIALPGMLSFIDQKSMKIDVDVKGNSLPIMVINTSLLVMQNTAGFDFKKILLLNNNIAFACDGASERVFLDVADIRWRTERTKRRWLAGTVTKQQLAILDADIIIESIDG